MRRVYCSVTYLRGSVKYVQSISHNPNPLQNAVINDHDDSHSTNQYLFSLHLTDAAAGCCSWQLTDNGCVERLLSTAICGGGMATGHNIQRLSKTINI